MKLSLDEFFSNSDISDYKKVLKKTSTLNELDKHDIIVIDEGVIQVQADNTLKTTFKTRDNLFWAAYKIKDFSHKFNLFTINELWEYQKKKAIYNQDNYPIRILQKLFPEDDYFTTTFKGEKCRRCLKHNEYQRIKGEMGKDRFAALVENIVEQEKQCLWSESSPTVETPYELYIYGADDETYVKFFSSKKDLFGLFNKIIRKPLTRNFFNTTMVLI